MKITSFKYLIIYISLIVLPLSLVGIFGYFIPSLNAIALKSYYVYYGGISLSITSLIILFLTKYFIKHNLEDKDELIDNKYLLKTNLIFIIFHLIILIISQILNYYDVSNYFVYALYLFYPLIYFCLILFLEPNKLNKKSITYILLSIYLLWYLLLPLLNFVFYNINDINLLSIKSLMYNLLYNYLRFSLLVLPFMSLGLIKISNEKKEKSLVHKFYFSIPKLFIFAFILVIIAILVSVILSR